MCWRFVLALTAMIDAKRTMMRQPNRAPSKQRSDLADALASCRETFVATALMCGMSNILMLLEVPLMPAGVDAIVLQSNLKKLS